LQGIYREFYRKFYRRWPKVVFGGLKVEKWWDNKNEG